MRGVNEPEGVDEGVPGAHLSRRQMIGGAAVLAAATGSVQAAGAAAPTMRLPKGVVVGLGADGKSHMAYERQMPESARTSPAFPLLAWDATPVAPNDGSYVAALSDRKEPWSFESLFPKDSGVRVLYSIVAPGQSFYLHATPSIDVCFVLSGRIVMELDDGEVELEAGDVVLQNATRHNWRNVKGNPPCILGAVVLSPRIGERTG